MRATLSIACAVCVLCSGPLRAQEAEAGVDLRGTLTAETITSNELTEAPRHGSPTIAAVRAVAYPTVKLNENWFMTGSVQLVTRPYYYSDLSTTGYNSKGNLLQATLNYSRTSDKGSFLLRGGAMETAFGSFVLRYDDADNALVDIPPQYGYYYTAVSILGLMAVQADGTRGKWDGRLQFANSSPANPHGPFAQGQYGNWAGGGGYTIRQGFRVGFAGYRGPYLDHKYAYYYPGEALPSKLPAHAIGVDANWSHRHTVVYAEMDRFAMPYTVIPTFKETAGYAEIRQVLTPRIFAAGRFSVQSTNATERKDVIEASFGYRPNRHQLLKIGYEFNHYGGSSQSAGQILGIQFVTNFHQSAAWR